MVALESYTGKVSTADTVDADEATNEPYWSLAKVKRAYLDYLGAKREEIDEQQSARSYRHGAQWTKSQVEVFNKRKQPVVTYNRIGRKIDSIVGLMEKLKQDPKAFPRNPNVTDETGAELATSVIRYVLDAELKDVLFPFAIENAAVDGLGGVEMMLIEGDKGDPDVGFNRVKPEDFFYDPRSLEHDFSDARFMGIGKWLDFDDAKALAPDKADDIENAVQTGSDLTSSPANENRWFHYDLDFRRIRVVEIWYKHHGGWCYAIFTGFLKIAEGKGYFFNEKGQGICKYIMFSSFIDQDGDRYGFVRNLRSSQDEVNQRRSKGLHELNSRRITAEDGAFNDVEVTRREAVRPDGVVIYNKGFEMAFDDATRIANVEGQLKFLEDAKNEIENFGPNPALIGQGLEYKSGRAINLLQQAGIAELGPFVIGVRNWKLRMYRAIWCAVQRYWTAERWVRVTDTDGLAQYIQVNGVGVDPSTGLPRMVNALGQLDVNFVLDEGPDEINMMADAYDTLVALTAQGANIPPQILLELAPLQSSVKKKLLAILDKPDPATDAMKAATIAGEQAKTVKTQSEAALNQAKTQQTAQGAATGIIERQMDAFRTGQEHQAKMANEATKVASAREQGRIKAAQALTQLHAQRIKGVQDVQINAIKNVQDLRHAEEMHRAKVDAARIAARRGGKPGV